MEPHGGEQLLVKAARDAVSIVSSIGSRKGTIPRHQTSIYISNFVLILTLFLFFCFRTVGWFVVSKQSFAIQQALRP